MQTLFGRFARDESGATSIEYGLIAVLISVAIIVGARAVSGETSGMFNTVSTAMQNAAGG